MAKKVARSAQLASAEAAEPEVATKYVYFFGNGKADGNRHDEGPARRQGRRASPR